MCRQWGRCRIGLVGLLNFFPWANPRSPCAVTAHALDPVRAKIKSADPKASAPLATTASESRLFKRRVRHRLHRYSLLMVKAAP
jgi:hypothetical protein